MKILTTKTLDSYKPCYPASRYFTEDWRGTVLDIAKDDRIPFNDRLWIIIREDLVSEKLMRLFAVWCARQVRKNHPDKKLKEVLDIVVAYCFGEVSSAELDRVRYDAAVLARKSVAMCVSGDNDWHGPWYAGWAAAASADTFVQVAQAARYASSSAAWAGPLSVAVIQVAQEKQLIAMLEAGVRTGDAK